MDKFKKLIAEALEVSESEISMNAALDSHPNFDSLAMVIILAKIDEHYSKQLKAEDIRKAKTLNDIYKLVEKTK
ncbi:MAG TPA: acyl carrier protein [Ignavibacteriaceae bacterium]|nr:acyl carrier protein [Ignavibacteriaceae bacterium]